MQTGLSTTEKSRLLIYNVAKGNPQAILAAIDEVKRLAEEALKGTLGVAERRALTLLANRIDEIERHYDGRLADALKSLEKLIERKVKAIEPRKGEKGDKGDKPTEAELLMLIEPLIPFVKDGEDGKTPGRDALVELMRPLIAETLMNSQPTREAVAEAEKRTRDTLEGMIKNEVAKLATELKNHGGGVSGDTVRAGDGIQIVQNVLGQKVISTVGGFSVIVPTGDVDNVNRDFVFTTKPTLLNVNGTFYRENHGWTWNAGTLTATISFTPGEGGDVFGMI